MRWRLTFPAIGTATRHAVMPPIAHHGAMTSTTSSGYAEALAAARSAYGGFGPRAGLPSEPEPRALAAMLALQRIQDDALRDRGLTRLRQHPAWKPIHEDADGLLLVRSPDVPDE